MKKLLAVHYDSGLRFEIHLENICGNLRRLVHYKEINTEPISKAQINYGCCIVENSVIR